MTLLELIDGLPVSCVIGDSAVGIAAVRDDSRRIEPGDVFVAVPGMRSDGHAFVRAAIERGARAVVVERALEAEQVRSEMQQAGARELPTIVVVPSSLRALGSLVAARYGRPGDAMTLIGITGTNGKTTTAYLVEAILRAAGKHVGLISTVEMRFGKAVLPASYTTPTPEILHDTLAKMWADGCTHVVMEVTSAALALERVAGMKFAVAAFSNLTQDHLDVHGSMDAYRAAKQRLFTNFMTSDGIAVINVDDSQGQQFLNLAPTSVAVSCDPQRPAAIRVTRASSTVRGIRMTVNTPRGELQLESKPLIGNYNVQNIALATGIAEVLKVPPAAIARGIENTAPPGRLERVSNYANLDIFVDYAHTPDALRNVLTTLRALTTRRLICLFGCGGDRDPIKRPQMGAVVAEHADVVVVTSDNPRTEDPYAILDMILPSVPKPFLVDADRKVAIQAAVVEATPGDVVVIAGKGHEDYQIIASPEGGARKVHFDDREEAAAAAANRIHRSLADVARDTGGEARHGDGASADRVVIDSRLARPGALYVAIRGDTHDGHSFVASAMRAGAVGVMVDRAGQRSVAPHIPTIVVDDTRIALGALARAHRRAWASAHDSPAPAKKVVAITGSAGKTTTKELTRAALAMVGPTHAAQGSFNNETGVPLTLLALRRFHRYCVVEMGMRGEGQIEYLTKIAEPDVAVVVNAGTAHIELLGSTDAIAKAKGEIWRGLESTGTVVRPVGDTRLEQWARFHAPNARHLTFGPAQDGTADVALLDYQPTGDGATLTIGAFGERRQVQLQLAGYHAAIDACAAVAAACAAGASIDQALAGLARQRPLAMRGEIIEVANRKVIVDCYNANPASMAAALHTLAERSTGQKAIAVLGDMLELGEHSEAAHREIGALARQLGIAVIALGEYAKPVVEAAEIDAEVAPSPEAAAQRLLSHSGAGSWILLKASRGMKLERVLEAMQKQTEHWGGT